MAEVPNRALPEHEGFDDLVRAAAEYHRLRPALVFKDYWVTRVLRAIASDPARQSRVLFKGGTSLSKGWHLIDRFSEDVDLLLTGPSFGSMPQSRGARRAQFKALQARIEAETPLRLPDTRAMTRAETAFFYFRGEMNLKLRYPLPGKPATPRGPSMDPLFIEPGYRGGPYPRQRRRPIRSLITEFLDTQAEARAALEAYRVDLEPFEMDLLNPERTFAEKLLLLHAHMIQGLEGARKVPTRHYYDLAQLFTRSDDVKDCLANGELRALVQDAARISNAYWGTKPEVTTLDLCESPALRLTPKQTAILTSRYEDEIERSLYFRDRVPFSEILARTAKLRDQLIDGAWR